jgi:hypothetical protein
MKYIFAMLLIASPIFAGCSQEQLSQPEQLSGAVESVQSEQALDVDLIKKLDSKERKVVNEYIAELDRQINKGTVTDIKDKYKIYSKIKSNKNDAAIIYKTVSLLSRVPLDNSILSSAKDDLKSTDSSRFIAGYTYLFGKDEKYLVDNCKFYEYEKIDPFVKSMFAGTIPVVQSREIWLEKTIDRYLKWQPNKSGKKLIMDEGNPYRIELLKEHNFVAEYIVQHAEKYANPVLDHSLIWLLGEIGSPCATELLLAAHCAKPDYRTAISLGACAGSLQLELLVEKLDDNSKKIYLESILTPEEYQNIKDHSKKEIKDYLIENWEKLKKRCKLRSIPQLG